MTGRWPWYTPADYAELEERNEMLAKELAEANDSLDRIKPQRDAMQQAIRDQESELAEATARTDIPEWVQEIRMYRDDLHGKDWWIAGMSSGYGRPDERRRVGEAYKWTEAMADALHDTDLTPTPDPEDDDA